MRKKINEKKDKKKWIGFNCVFSVINLYKYKNILQKNDFYIMYKIDRGVQRVEFLQKRKTQQFRVV